MRVRDFHLSPFVVSAIAHGAISLFVYVLVTWRPSVENVPLEVIIRPKAAAPVLQPQAAPVPKPPSEPPVEKRQVFGVSRHALRDQSEDAEGAEIKAGNTVTKAPDQERLLPDDVDTLPIPTDEYLVTEMPTLLVEMRVPYPPEAKERGVEGRVVLDLLIDSAGLVREANLVSGLGFGLDEAALAAIRKCRFKPARVGSDAVAVRTRFIYNFILER